MSSLLRTVARASWRVNKTARIAQAYQRGGMQAVGRQYVRRAATRTIMRGLFR